LFGRAAALPDHLAIGAAFMACPLSVLRSYMLRRSFEAWPVCREQSPLILLFDHQTIAMPRI
jgi:hypothetical protein